MKLVIKLLSIFMITLLLLLVVYPFAIKIFIGDEIPENWKSGFTDKTRAAVVLILGAPDESPTVKGYESWIVNTWWGRQELKLFFNPCCGNDSKVSYQSVTIYVNRFIFPVSRYSLD